MSGDFTNEIAFVSGASAELRRLLGVEHLPAENDLIELVHYLANALAPRYPMYENCPPHLIERLAAIAGTPEATTPGASE